ncbi:carbon storage regulator CsrA [Tundrisphaera sp. TA3]|uniref:carbon storage regulator CsrA n=1 Tax=Tundrisphaera sp. TA3 TaxID=3435775 RepID=UPI003EC017A7
MLVLSRKQLEGIVIGNNIRIKIVKIDRNQVRLGIEAPEDVLIVRNELMHPEEEEAREARLAWEASESSH